MSYYTVVLSAIMVGSIAQAHALFNTTTHVTQAAITTQPAAQSKSELENLIEKNSVYIENLLFLLYSVVFVLGVIGNSLVIYVLMSSLCTDRRSQNLNTAVSVVALTRVNSLKANNNNNKQENGGGGGQAAGGSVENGKQLKDRRNTSYAVLVNRSSSLVKNLVKEKLSVTNLYLINLAFCDLIYLLTIPFLVCTIYYEQWKFNMIFCKIYFSQIYLCQCSIVFLLVVLSIDRYLSVKYPHKVNQFRSDSRARIVILATWLLSFLVISPIPFYTTLSTDESNVDLYSTTPTPAPSSLSISTANPSSPITTTQPAASHVPTCLINWPGSWELGDNKSSELVNFLNLYLSPLHAFTFYTFLLNYILPVLIIIILYTGILKRLHARGVSKQLKKSKAKKKSHKKITKMVLTIIVCYMVCWTPYWFIQIAIYLSSMFGSEFNMLLILIYNFIQVLCYTSSMLNPFIYSYMSEAFKVDLKRACSHCYCCVRFLNKNQKPVEQQPPTSPTSPSPDKKIGFTNELPSPDSRPAKPVPYLSNGKRTVVFEEELDNLNEIETVNDQQTATTTGQAAKKKPNTIHKLVLKSKKNYEFEIKFHGLKTSGFNRAGATGGGGGQTSWLNRLMKK